MQRKIIPVVPAPDPAPESCEAAEPFALMVLGDSMLPEFAEGEIIIVEPEGLARDGSYVVAQHEGEPVLRRLVEREGRWWLHALNPAYPDAELAGIGAVRGVVIQKSKPGSRRSRKSYVD
ncbi:MAG: S24 family peptidase [Rhodocyclaceae bacterium]|mgnify:CR=1 FL=1|jgi:DNA polymerase V|nr:LexA repressor [Rhodocyclaceae bacterium]MBZ0144054.1 S24 family peptidase [Rhodocyclaceae bacterium]MCC6879013.1 S24 family peptidase [Rhodocyclaceae bacterium]MCL4682602.1 S24 family peptidase [Rhodocyclaceae bacterium]